MKTTRLLIAGGTLLFAVGDEAPATALSCTDSAPLGTAAAHLQREIEPVDIQSVSQVDLPEGLSPHVIAVQPAQAAPITVQELIEIPEIQTLSVAPSGQSMVFSVVRADVEANAYHIGWMHRQVDASRPAAAIADGGAPIESRHLSGLPNGSFVSSSVLWAPDEDWIGFLRSTERGVQLWRASFDGTPPEQITDIDGDVIAMSWSPDRQAVSLRVSREASRLAQVLAEEYDSGYRYDGRFVPYASTRPVHFTEFVHPYGRGPMRTAVEAWTWNPRTGTVALDPASEPSPPDYAGGQTNDVPARTLQVSSSAGRVALTVPAQGAPGVNPPRVVAWQDEGAEPQLCVLAECRGRLTWLQWRTDRELVFAKRESAGGALTTIYTFDVESQRIRRLFTTQSELAQCAVRGGSAYCIESAAAIPSRVVQIDLEDGALTILDAPGALLEYRLPQPHLISVQGRGAQDTFAYIYLPSVASRRPQRTPVVVVTYECRGFMPGGTGNEYPIALLVQHGFAVLCFQSQTIDAHAARSRTWGDYVSRGMSNNRSDLGILLNSLKIAVGEAAGRYHLDGDNVGMTGLSHGADFTLYALSRWGSIRAAIVSGGAQDSLIYDLGGSYTQQWYRYWGLPSPHADRRPWDARAVLSRAEHVTAPLLINTSDQEFQLALPMYNGLIERGHTIEMYVYPDEAHIKSQPRHRWSVYQRNLEWLDRWLRAGPADHH